MTAKRLIWADSLKGWLIILVVLGHAIQYTVGNGSESCHLWSLIYSFHMPAFVAISGFLAYRNNGVVGGGISWNKVYRRFRQLVIPFGLWTIVLLTVINCLNLQSMVKYLLYPDNGLWFLWVLFFINVLFLFSDWSSRKFRVKSEVVVLILCILLAILMALFKISLFGLQLIAFYFLFYSLGYYMHKYYDRFFTSNRYVIIPLTIVWMVLGWFWQMHELPFFLKGNLVPETIFIYAYRYLTATLAIYVMLAIAPNLISKESKWNLPFVRIGVVSLGIYATHLIMMSKIIAIIRELNLSETMVIVISFICALAISWLLVWLLTKWKVTSVCLLGKI
ncbi:acyltransferase family protein [Prevotella communis]|uniref:acyltransferase family protein n=1 Tax=Prevotella communis TaxID=2913614 RepID=UPI001EDC1332|nr:acyltransferase family protein [Prevotella communis]UKK67581.1 acyltransferase family protein [Prevotella communis]UKK70273.1 acyltransferase family protein [Prevotella communis]